MAEIRRSPLNVSSFSHYLQVFLMPSRWCRISEPSTVLLRQMVGITQNQVLFLLKKILLPFNWKVKKTGTKIWWIWNNLPRFLRWHGDFKYQLWFHFTTFSHSKKNNLPHWRASCGTSGTWWCHLVIAATLLGTWKYHDRLMKQISNIAFSEDFWPSNKTNISYLGKFGKWYMNYCRIW